MSIKATIIGGGTQETGSAVKPTRLGSPDSGGPKPATPVIAPTALKPTALPGAAPAPMPASVPLQPKPTALPVSAPATAIVAVEPVRASALPGTQRKPMEVEFDTLAKRFPGTVGDMLVRTQAVLAGVSPQAMDTSAWLRFGVTAQESLTDLVKQRLGLMQSSAVRNVTQHLSRLQSLLQEVLESMDGGLFRKPVAKVWGSVVGEVRQLESLLSSAGSILAANVSELERLSKDNHEAGEALQANALAAEYLLDQMDAQVGQLLVARLTSITGSQALVLEQLQMLTLDKERVQEIMTLVQDGVLLQLPAVYSQLAGLSAKPSDTQRYLAVEKLTDIVQFIQRKV